MGGSSGAKIEFLASGRVRKIGDVRVGMQGKWLAANPAPGLPMIFSAHPEHYDMEFLHVRPDGVLFSEDMLEEMTDEMQRSVWSHPAQVEPDFDAHVIKMLPLSGVMVPRSQRKFSAAMWQTYSDLKHLRTCLTHGDPTVDNVMRRRNGDMVISDPIPATPAIPDLWAVDLGKILQSVRGYEAMRYGKTTMNGLFRRLDLKLDVSPIDWRAAQYFHVVHLLRAVPYMTDERIRNELIIWANAYAARL